MYVSETCRIRTASAAKGINQSEGVSEYFADAVRKVERIYDDGRELDYIAKLGPCMLCRTSSNVRSEGRVVQSVER